jgi:hypothetical protein
MRVAELTSRGSFTKSGRLVPPGRKSRFLDGVPADLGHNRRRTHTGPCKPEAAPRRPVMAKPLMLFSAPSDLTAIGIELGEIGGET